jgi:hypothetical protein
MRVLLSADRSGPDPRRPKANGPRSLKTVGRRKFLDLRYCASPLPRTVAPHIHMHMCMPKTKAAPLVRRTIAASIRLLREIRQRRDGEPASQGDWPARLDRTTNESASVIRMTCSPMQRKATQ